MDSAARQSDYADARYVSAVSEALSTRNGDLDEVQRTEDEGVGVRVRVGGAWGFAATRQTTKAAAEDALRRALDIARAQPSVPTGELAPAEPARGSWRSAADRDPFDVPVEEKAGLLLAADRAMRGDPRITLTRAHFMGRREERTFASTEGALCDQVVTECGGGIAA